MSLKARTTNIDSQGGLTLIEMMIAMVLGLFVTAVIITVFSTNVRSNTENIKMIRLNQELRGVMTLMVDEIKKHGYSIDPTDNSYMKQLGYDTVNNCLNYSYDSDISDGSFDPTKDLFGIHFTASTIYWQTSPNTSCSSSSSNQPLTELNIAEITTLDFDFSGSSNRHGSTFNTGIVALTTTTGTSLYEVTITLTGTTDLPHSSDAEDPRRTIIETIRIRNEDPKD